MHLTIAIMLQCQNPAVEAPKWYLGLLPLIPVLSPFIAVYTFWLGSRQKENERCFDFYNEVVVTPLMSDLDTVFDLYREKLIAEASKQIREEGRLTVPRDITKLVTEFSEALYGLKDRIVKRVEVFDDGTVRKIQTIVEQLDTDIAGHLCSKIPKDAEIVSQTLIIAKRQLIRSIYKGKFTILR